MLQKIPGWLILFFTSTPLLAQTPARMDSTMTLSQALDLAERNFPQLLAATGNKLNNKEVMFSVKSYPGQTFKATLGRQTQSVDINTRTEISQFDVSNPTGELRPGMFADVKLNLSRNQPSFYVPFSAVVTSLEKSFVIRVHHGQTEWVDVGKGMAFEDKVEIFGPLNQGDTLVQQGSEELKPEKKVAVKFVSKEKQQALSAIK